jgi:hypothetical protein
MKLRIIILLASAFCFCIHTKAQTSRLRVFMDCQSGCDMNYIRTEINIVDFVLDRLAADVHVLITDQNTGSGGDKYQLIFFGQNSFAHMQDTLYFDNDANNTDFEERELLVKYLKLGLTPFIAKTKMAKGISIQMKTAEKTTDAKKDSINNLTKDPWNYWVFQVNVNGNVEADEVYKTNSINTDLSASRVTEKLKTGLSFNGGKNKSIYKVKDDSGYIRKITVRNENYELSNYLIKSITDHWSWGYEAKLSRNSFSNIKYQPLFRTGIEYNIFPYKLVNTKYFTIGYILDFRRNVYFDSTIYDKTKETLAGHSLETKLTINQKWGTVELGAEYHNYFHNWKYLNLEANMNINIRITGGLSFYIHSSAELIRDQLFLPKKGSSTEEILTKRREIATGYKAYAVLGIGYRFGSNLNNFVNPRFGF